MVSLDVHEKLVDITKIKNAVPKENPSIITNGDMKEDDDKEDDDKEDDDKQDDNKQDDDKENV